MIYLSFQSAVSLIFFTTLPVSKTGLAFFVKYQKKSSDTHLRTSNLLTPRVGLEPTTPRLTAVCSTIELSRIIIPSKLHIVQTIPNRLRSSLRPISIRQLHTLLYFHLGPIYLVVFKGSYWLTSGISYLEGGFTLRCLQRLSRPDLATRLCTW